MSDSFRRFEILLPRRFNDGQPVPDQLIADALLELEERFGAVSCETQLRRLCFSISDSRSHWPDRFAPQSPLRGRNTGECLRVPGPRRKRPGLGNEDAGRKR